MKCVFASLGCSRVCSYPLATERMKKTRQKPRTISKLKRSKGICLKEPHLAKQASQLKEIGCGNENQKQGSEFGTASC